MKSLPLLLLAFLLLGPTASAADKSPGIFIYRVDLQKAMTAIPEGQAVRKKLETEHRRKQKELDAWARALEAKRAAAEKSGDEAMQKEVQQDQQRLMQGLVDAQRSLLEEEERQVQKIVGELKRIIVSIEADRPQVRILASTEVRPINLPAVCDRTEWLVQARVSGEAPPLVQDHACRFARFARVDMQRIMDDSQAGRAALARLTKEYK